MVSILRYSGLLLFVGIVTCSNICPDPSVSVTTFTTEDGTVVTNVAYVSHFTLKCSNGATDIPLFAEVGGVSLPVVQTGLESYQVSWVEDVNKARSGEHSILLYDEEGYANLRKAARSSEQANIEPLIVVKLHHPGTYRGPWLNSEFMAAMVATLVWYMAYTTKSKLLSTKQS